ncbi:MAG: TerB family tellurite resistance protein [Bacteroidales bacterium]|nr:TerB family tellurite resistance protein [Bacteroidales bacterium]
MNLSVFDQMALSVFTSLEKQSVFQLLYGAMQIDGICDNREIATINKVNQILKITDADVEASRKLDETTMVGCLRNMDTLKKIYVAKFMAQVILADGHVDPKEEMFFNYIQQKLDLPNIE